MSTLAIVLLVIAGILLLNAVRRKALRRGIRAFKGGFRGELRGPRDDR